MKKMFSILMVLTLLLTHLMPAALASNEKLTIVTTIYPLYNWTRELLGEQVDEVELIFLIDNGVDLHSYQPSIKDIATISNCDVFIYNGGDSDVWVEDVIAQNTNPNFVSINAMDLMGDRAKSVGHGEGIGSDMDALEEHAHAHEHDEDCEHEHEHEHDEDCDHEHEHDEDCDHEHEHDEDCTDSCCTGEQHEHEHDED